MAFDIRAGSDALHAPVFTFPGDETIDGPTYDRAIFSGYLSSVSTLYGAARGFGLEIDGESFERWKRLGAAAGLLDDFLDESGDIQDAHARYDDGLTRALEGDEDIVAPAWADKRLPAAMRLLQHSTHALPEAQKTALIGAARTIGKLATVKAACTDPDEYIGHLETEGRQTAVLVHASTSEYVRSQDKHGLFEQWCASTMICATLADCSRDLWKDYAEGRVGVTPSPKRSLQILFSIRHYCNGLYNSPSAVRASLSSLAARSRFSLRPTNATMLKYQRASEA